MLRVFAAHDDQALQAQLLPTRGEQRLALAVGNDHARTGIGDAEGEFARGEPGVERHRDGTDAGNGPERDRPLRQVAHRDRDPVPLADAVARAQRLSEPAHLAMVAGVTQAPVVEHEARPFAILGRSGKNVAEHARPVLPGTDRDAPDLDLFELEGKPGAHEAIVGFRPAQTPGYGAPPCAARSLRIPRSQRSRSVALRST